MCTSKIENNILERNCRLPIVFAELHERQAGLKPTCLAFMTVALASFYYTIKILNSRNKFTERIVCFLFFSDFALSRVYESESESSYDGFRFQCLPFCLLSLVYPTVRGITKASQSSRCHKTCELRIIFWFDNLSSNTKPRNQLRRVT